MKKHLAYDDIMVDNRGLKCYNKGIMNDMVKGFRSPKTMRQSDRIRRGPTIMSQRKKRAIAKTTTAPEKEAVTEPQPLPQDVLPDTEHIQAYGKCTVEVGQNTIFVDNTGEKSVLRLTDVGIAEVWNKAWPNRKIVAERGGYNARHVVGARRDYNKGTHGKNADGEVIVPKIKCGKWVFNKETHEKKYIDA
jgi:hypothetical protein